MTVKRLSTNYKNKKQIILFTKKIKTSATSHFKKHIASIQCLHLHNLVHYHLVMQSS